MYRFVHAQTYQHPIFPVEPVITAKAGTASPTTNASSCTCHPREGGDPVPEHDIQQMLHSSASVQRQGVPAFAGMTGATGKKGGVGVRVSLE